MGSQISTCGRARLQGLPVSTCPNSQTLALREIRQLPMPSWASLRQRDVPVALMEMRRGLHSRVMGMRFLGTVPTRIAQAKSCVVCASPLASNFIQASRKSTFSCTLRRWLCLRCARKNTRIFFE